jgi:uncharacterized membrane protein YeaQ/YmgE (transglycosylase-associated protein family)
VGILAWIIVGFIGGSLGKLLLPGRDPGGIILTVLLGIAGAIVGGFIAVALDISNGVDDFDIGSIILSIVGTILILSAYRMVASRA